MLFQKETQTLQFLPVKGIINARDLGGYVTADGRTVRSGKLIRAASLADATDADLRYLKQVPLALSDTDIATLRERYLK